MQIKDKVFVVTGGGNGIAAHHRDRTVKQPGVQMPEPETRGHRTADLPRHEGLAPARALVVEEDSVGGEQAVAVAIVPGDPVGEQLRGGVWALRAKDGRLALRRRRCAVELAGRGLVEPGLLLELEDADGLQEPERTETCLLYTSDAADERSSVDLGGRRIIKKKKHVHHEVTRTMIKYT